MTTQDEAERFARDYVTSMSKTDVLAAMQDPQNYMEESFLAGFRSRDAEIEKIQQDKASNDYDYIELSKLNNKKDSEIKRLRDALGYYSIEENHKVIFYPHGHVAYGSDVGKRAREALKDTT